MTHICCEREHSKSAGWQEREISNTKGSCHPARLKPSLRCLYMDRSLGMLYELVRYDVMANVPIGPHHNFTATSMNSCSIALRSTSEK